MARLVLVGLPGVGKSSVARQLGVEWACPVLDTDEVLAANVGGPAAEYLRREGERAFRRAELVALEGALTSPGVVATGGGVVTTAHARELLRAEVTCWLDCDDDVLLARLGDVERPLLGEDAAGALARLRAQRTGFYDEVSRVRVDASGTLDEVTRRVRDSANEVVR